MKRLTTILPLLLLGLGFVGTSLAQDAQVVSINQINAISDSSLAVLNAGGENLSAADITANIFNELNGARVQFTAVLMSDPFNSGLSNVTDGRVNRVHVFVRDTLASSEGPDGMGIQLVDGAYETTGLLNFGIGDVITVTGSVGPFGTTMQIAPETIELVGRFDDAALGLNASIMDPVVVGSDDINMAVGSAGGVQTNWDNLANLRGQFVRIEAATLQARSLANPDRPDFYASTDGGTTVANFYDTGIQFRNDQSAYPDEFNVQDDDFVPPPPGAVVNIQGFLLFQGGADQIGRSLPANGILSLAPMERRGCADPESGLRCDFEVTESPPIVGNPSKPASVPGADEAVTISSTITVDPARTLDSATLNYFTSADSTEQSVEGTQDGENFTFTIPGQADNVFVCYNVTGTDNTGASITSGNENYRVLDGGIDAIRDIQEWFGECGTEASPFAGMTVDMNISGIAMSDPASTGFLIVQDDGAINSGIVVEDDSAVVSLGIVVGDSVSISAGTIQEIRGDYRFDRSGNVTGIGGPTVTKGGAGTPFDPLPTGSDGVGVDDTIAEEQESMLSSFDDPVITATNADDPIGPFGEFNISTDGGTSNFRVDDASSAISYAGNDPGTVYSAGQRLDFVQGFVSFTFGNYKLMPRDSSDIGMVINTAVEDDVVPGTFALEQNYPNPFNPVTTIEYTVPATGLIRLEVFDLLGRSVAVLVNGEQAVGVYAVQFDASQLASGLYFYRVSAGTQTKVRQMMLIK